MGTLLGERYLVRRFPPAAEWEWSAKAITLSRYTDIAIKIVPLGERALQRPGFFGKRDSLARCDIPIWSRSWTAGILPNGRGYLIMELPTREDPRGQSV